MNKCRRVRSYACADDDFTYQDLSILPLCVHTPHPNVKWNTNCKIKTPNWPLVTSKMSSIWRFSSTFLRLGHPRACSSSSRKGRKSAHTQVWLHAASPPVRFQVPGSPSRREVADSLPRAVSHTAQQRGCVQVLSQWGSSHWQTKSHQLN